MKEWNSSKNWSAILLINHCTTQNHYNLCQRTSLYLASVMFCELWSHQRKCNFLASFKSKKNLFAAFVALNFSSSCIAPRQGLKVNILALHTIRLVHMNTAWCSIAAFYKNGTKGRRENSNMVVVCAVLKGVAVSKWKVNGNFGVWWVWYDYFPTFSASMRLFMNNTPERKAKCFTYTRRIYFLLRN